MYYYIKHYCKKLKENLLNVNDTPEAETGLNISSDNSCLYYIIN